MAEHQAKVFVDDFDDGQVLEKSNDGRWYLLVEEAPAGTKPEEADVSSLGYDSDNGHMVIWNQTIFNFKANKASTSRQQKTSRHDGVKDIEHKFEKLKQIDHANVIKFYDYWFNQDKDENSKQGQNQAKNFKLVWITELMTGVTLRKYLRNTKKAKTKLPSKIWKKWCEQILSALSYMHERDIAHGNIKPSTVHVQHHGGIKIGAACIDDFHQGIKTMKQGAKFADWAYLAPEGFDTQEAKKEQDGTSKNTMTMKCLVDVYAFGMTALEMITLRVPYAEFKTSKEFEQARLEENKLPQDLDDFKDEEKKKFIMACIEDVQSRPTAAKLLKNNVLMEFPRLESFAAKEVAKYVKNMERAAEDQDAEEFNPNDPTTYSSFDSTKFLDELLYDKYANWFKPNGDSSNNTSNTTTNSNGNSTTPTNSGANENRSSGNNSGTYRSYRHSRTISESNKFSLNNNTSSSSNTSNNTTPTASNQSQYIGFDETPWKISKSLLKLVPPEILKTIDPELLRDENCKFVPLPVVNMVEAVVDDVVVDAGCPSAVVPSGTDVSSWLHQQGQSCIEYDEDGSKHIEGLQTMLEEAIGKCSLVPKQVLEKKPNPTTVERGVVDSSDISEDLDEQTETAVPLTHDDSSVEIPTVCSHEQRRVTGNPVCVVNEHQDIDVKYEINVTLQLRPAKSADLVPGDTAQASQSYQVCERAINFPFFNKGGNLTAVVDQMEACGLINESDKRIVGRSIQDEINRHEDSKDSE